MFTDRLMIMRENFLRYYDNHFDSRYFFWNTMCSVVHDYSEFNKNFYEIESLIIVKSIEALFPGKYKAFYYDKELDVLDRGYIRHGAYSHECEVRSSIIMNFSNNASRKEILEVIDKAIDMASRYDKLFFLI